MQDGENKMEKRLLTKRAVCRQFFGGSSKKRLYAINLDGWRYPAAEMTYEQVMKLYAEGAKFYAPKHLVVPRTETPFEQKVFNFLSADSYRVDGRPDRSSSVMGHIRHILKDKAESVLACIVAMFIATAMVGGSMAAVYCICSMAATGPGISLAWVPLLIGVLFVPLNSLSKYFTRKEEWNNERRLTEEAKPYEGE